MDSSGWVLQLRRLRNLLVLNQELHGWAQSQIPIVLDEEYPSVAAPCQIYT
mgnify:CR=1 FL=1